jgi:endonuclease YncB( thermonuclease family)
MSEMDRQSTEMLIGIVCLILVAVLYLQRPPVEPKTVVSSKPASSIIKSELERQTTASPKPLPTMVKPELERQNIASPKPLPTIVKPQQLERQTTPSPRPLPTIIKPGLEDQTTTASPKPLPTIIKPGENWLSPSDISVVDGDTIRVRARTVRLVGFDAPETGGRARCHRERELAQRATEQLRKLVAGGGLDLRMVPCACPPGTEGTSACNFGRACGSWLANGRDVGMTLISQSLAKPFHCGKQSCPPPPTWC